MRSSFVAYVIVVALAAAYLAKHAEYNWDMIPYTAAVLALDEQDPAAIHAETYRLVRAEVPPDRLEAFNATEYRHAVAESPRALMQQLPFYRIRPAYLVTLRACSALGVSPARATVLVSAFAYVALCMLIWAWLRGCAPIRLRFACAALLAVSQPLLHVGGLTNPDALSTAVVVLAFYLFVIRGRAGWALLVLLAAVLVRSDNVFLCALFAAYLLWRERHAARVRRLFPAAVGAASVAWVVVWHHAVGNYGWWLTMYHSFIAPLATPADGMPPMSSTQLGKMWIGGLATLRHSPLSLCVLVFLCAWALRPRDPARRDARDAALVMLASIGVHFAVFPNLEDRFFVAHYVVIALVSAGWLLDAARARLLRAVAEPAQARSGS